MILSRAVILFLLISSLCPSFYSCTLSFQNISTHGKTEIDDKQAPDNDIKTVAEIPI